MYRANIIKQTIISHSSIVDKILSHHHALVSLSNTELIFEHNGAKMVYPLTFMQKDFSGTTYTSTAENDKIRVIVFDTIRANEFVKEQKAFHYFSIGSLSNNGFGIFFLVTAENDFRGNSISPNNDQESFILRLFEGASMALSNNDINLFIEIINNLLPLLQENMHMANKFQYSFAIFEILKNNKTLFNKKSQEIISLL